MDPIEKHDYPNWGEYRKALGALDPAISSGGGWGGNEWSLGVNSVGAALAIADKGWPEGMKKVESITTPAINSAISSVEACSAWGWDVTGADYDVGEFLTGTPDCWLDRTQEGTRPVITIMANCVSSGGIPAEAMARRGAAVVALILALQAGGYVVRVFAVEGMRISNKDIWHRVCLTDDQGGPLDMDRIVFALAHPAAARQLGYMLGASYVGQKGSCGISWPSNDPKTLPPEDWKRDLYLEAPYLDAAEWHDSESVAAWVAATYKALSEGRSSK